MACRCAARRQVISLAAGLAMRGRLEAIPPAAHFVARTMAEDAKAGVKAAVAAARQRITNARA